MEVSTWVMVRSLGLEARAEIMASSLIKWLDDDSQKVRRTLDIRRNATDLGLHMSNLGTVSFEAVKKTIRRALQVARNAYHSPKESLK